MSYFGYADFDKPIQFEAGNIYYPFGSGSFFLMPYRCAIADMDDGRANFSLDIVRSAAPSADGANGYATLEMRLKADYASERALRGLRERHPQATLFRCALKNWSMRLAPNPTLHGLTESLFNPIPLASDNLGMARYIAELPLDNALILENLLESTAPALIVIAEAEMMGIAPRLDVVVRFSTADLMPAVYSLATADGVLTWEALVTLFSENPTDLPLHLSGQLTQERRRAFGEAMADRIIGHYGAYLPATEAESLPQVRLLPMADVGARDLIWALGQPFLATRRLALTFDLLADVRGWVARDGIGRYVHRHTSSDLPDLGDVPLTVFCTLPAERVGVEALGVTVTFPPAPPARPQAKHLTVLLEPPIDLVRTTVRFAPGEPLRYTYQAVAVVSDAQGVRELLGPTLTGEGSHLRLSPDDFPLDFVMVDVSLSLGVLAIVTGLCTYNYRGESYDLPFVMDSGRFSVCLLLPKDSEQVEVTFVAQARADGETLRLGPYESRHIRLDLFSFSEYGWREIEITCDFGDRTTVYAIDVLPMGLPATSANIQTLAFTPTRPTRTFGWLSRSPFRVGFRYRPHQDIATDGAWQEVLHPPTRLVIEPERPIAQDERESSAVTAGYAYQPLARVTSPRRESQAGNGSSPQTPVPISPEETPTDRLLYHLHGDQAQKFYIPRYQLDVQTVSGAQRYRITMGQQNMVSSITVHLVRGPAPELADAAREAEPMPHDLSIRLTFLSVPPAGARKMLAFQDIRFNDEGVVASLTFATLGERDAVYRALTDPDYDAQLIVTRTVRIAVPSPTPIYPRPFLRDAKLLPMAHHAPLLARRVVANLRLSESAMLVTPTALQPVVAALPRPVSTNTPILANRINGAFLVDTVVNVRPFMLPTPTLVFLGEDIQTVRGNQFRRGQLRVTNWQDYSADFFKPAPDLAPCGANSNASRTWISIHDAANDAQLYAFCAFSDPAALADLWFSVPSTQALPERVYIRLEDRRAKVVRTSNVVETRVATTPTPSYREITSELEQPVDPIPFVFAPNLHSYIFQGIVPGGVGGGLVTFRVSWKGKYHTYLQDATRPNLVYFFPDAFKIARHRDAPFTPFITVRVNSKTGHADTEVVFDYVVAPYIDLERLEAARQILLADANFTGTEINFQPFITSDVRYIVDRPAENGTVREERVGVSLILQDMLKDSLVMSLADFRRLFDAMHMNTASLFMGRVEIEVPGESKEVIPFSARFDDLVGELFLYAANQNADGSLAISLVNATESPLRIDALDVIVARGDKTVGATVQGGVLPIERLDAGAGVDLKVVPHAPLSGPGMSETRFGVQHVHVLPDVEAIWHAILDRSTLAFFEMIIVKALPNQFTIDANGRLLVAIVVKFEGGGTAELDKDQLEVAVRVDYPIDDVLLRGNVDTSYRYTVTTVWSDGTQRTDATPRTGTATILFLTFER